MKILGGAVEYETLVEYEGELFIVENATFLMNFHPWVKGHLCRFLDINFETCTLTEISHDGTTKLQAGQFRLVPEIALTN